MTRPVNRPEPLLPVTAVKSYEIAAPVATHRRPATCAEVECGAYAHGWETTVPADSPQALYIRAHSGRAFTEEYRAPGSVTFVFPAGQRCFQSTSHTMSLERPAIFVVRDGDHRGNPTGRRRVHRTPEDWRDDMGEHQDAIAQAIERG